MSSGGDAKSRALRRTWHPLADLEIAPYRGRTSEGGNVFFEILRSQTTGMYWWRMVAANRRILAASEQYTAKQSCLNAIAIVKAEAAAAPIYDRT